MRHLRAKQAAGVIAWEAATYACMGCGVSCAARRLEGRPALLRGAALVGGRRSVLARGEMSGAAAGGSGMSGAAVPCSRNEFCGDSSARRDIIRHLKSQSNVGVRYVAKLAERRSCRLRGRHTGIYDLSTFNWAKLRGGSRKARLACLQRQGSVNMWDPSAIGGTRGLPSIGRGA